MSQFHAVSPKHGPKQGLNIDKLYKRLFYAFSTFFVSILSLRFLIWLILHPSKPQFSLKEADIYQLNFSELPHLLNSSIQITLLSKNPNNKVGMHHDQVQVYTSYKGQQTTVDTSLPPASLVGQWLPVAPSLGYEVVHDQTAGKLVLNLKANGRLGWKVGTWVSSWYRFNINCVAVMFFGPGMPTGPLTTKQGTQCSTTV